MKTHETALAALNQHRITLDRKIAEHQREVDRAKQEYDHQLTRLADLKVELNNLLNSIRALENAK